MYIYIAIHDSLHKEKPKDVVSTIASGFTMAELTSIACYGGYIYVSDATTIYRFRDGEAPTIYAGTNTSLTTPYQNGARMSARFRTISAMAVDSTNGDVYIADSPSPGVGTLRRLNSRDDTVEDVAGGINKSNVSGPAVAVPFQRISGLVAGSSGEVYVIDENPALDRLSKYSSTTNDLRTIAESAGSRWPGGIALDIG